MNNFACFAKNFVGSYFAKDIVLSGYFGVKVAKRDFAITWRLKILPRLGFKKNPFSVYNSIVLKLNNVIEVVFVQHFDSCVIDH